MRWDLRNQACSSLKLSIPSANLKASSKKYGGLLSETEQATPFQTFEWVLANLLAFENDGLHLLLFRQQQAGLVGFLPLVFRRGRRYVRAGRWLELATQPYADHGMATIWPTFEAGVAETLLDHLHTNKNTWTAVHLDKVFPHDSFIDQLRRLAPRQKFMVNARPTHHSRRVIKDSITAAAASKSLDKAAKRLSARGSLTFRVYTEPAEIEARLSTFFQLHAERFSAKGLRSPLLDARQQTFYNSLVRQLVPPNGVWLSCLQCDDVPIAMRFSLLRKQTLHLYATCFANEFAKYSPSMVQLRMLLHFAFSNGVEVVDFGVGDSPHKEHFGET